MTTWQAQKLEVNGARIHVARSGGGEGKPPVVLVHGFSDNGRCWPLLSRDLVAAYEVVLPDARGHGRSQGVAPGERLDMAADLAGVIRALGLDRPAVVGHSMGAATASQLGARFPEVVRALVLEDPPWRAAQAAPHPAPQDDEDDAAPPVNPLQQWIASLDGLSLDEIVARNRPEHPTWPDEVLRRWSAAKMELDRNFFLQERFSGEDWTEIVDAIQCPTLLVTATPDLGGIMTPELTDEVLQRNPRFTPLHIDGVGHHIRFAAYDRYAAGVLAFLAQVM